jgi:hypothetical protein
VIEDQLLEIERRGRDIVRRAEAICAELRETIAVVRCATGMKENHHD